MYLVAAPLNTWVQHLILFVLLFLFADRFSGGGLGWSHLSHDGGGPLRGRGIGYAAVLAMAVLTLTVGWKIGLLSALTFGIWRSPAWKIAGKGGFTPRTTVDSIVYFVRNMLAGGAVVSAYWLGRDWRVALVAVVAFAVLSVLLGRYNAHQTDKGRDVNGLVEMVRGGLFGTMLWVSLVSST